MKHTLSTTAVAKLLGVAVRSVVNWIDAGDLKAGKTPGGHRRVEEANLLEFLRRHDLPIPRELARAMTILLVDDDEAFLKWLKKEIAEGFPGCIVLVASDGYAAGDVVASHHPEIVILDLRMKGIDGYEVCTRIKAKPETADCRVIFVTAYPTAQAKRRATKCGAAAFLAKPIDRQELISAVEVALLNSGG